MDPSMPDEKKIGELTWVKVPRPAGPHIGNKTAANREEAMKREIISIDEEKCNGCGQCIPNCPEGALQLIDGKARLISDLFCDGLGACIGECPQGAIGIEEREAEAYDEKRVMENVVRQGENVIRAHLEHLSNHGEEDFLEEAIDFLEERNIRLDFKVHRPACAAAGCPGARSREIGASHSEAVRGVGEDVNPIRISELRQWPVQMHLIPPAAPYFRDCDLLLAADCTAYAAGDFHRDFLRGRKLIIACPKLDANQEIYHDKLVALIDHAGIRSMTVLTMEVPCCRGLLALVRRAREAAERDVPVRWVELSVEGKVLQEGIAG